MQVELTKLDDVLLITPNRHIDSRGTYVETYNEAEYVKAGIGCEFVQDDVSSSLYNVLRGIHGDAATWKLVSCPVGVIYLVVVNWDADSSQYRQWQAFNLTQHTHRQVLVPPKFGNGHLVLSRSAVFHYKQTTYYNQFPQFSIPYNDPELNIDWPVLPSNPPITSERDRAVCCLVGLCKTALDGSGIL